MAKGVSIAVPLYPFAFTKGDRRRGKGVTGVQVRTSFAIGLPEVIHPFTPSPSYPKGVCDAPKVQGVRGIGVRGDLIFDFRRRKGGSYLLIYLQSSKSLIHKIVGSCLRRTVGNRLRIAFLPRRGDRLCIFDAKDCLWQKKAKEPMD